MDCTLTNEQEKRVKLIEIHENWYGSASIKIELYPSSVNASSKDVDRKKRLEKVTR